jgi:hypothetical protein
VTPATSVTSTSPVVRLQNGYYTTDLVATSADTGIIDGTVTAGLPEFFLSVPFYNGDSPASAQVAKWEALTPANFYANALATMQAHGRLVHNPGAFPFNARHHGLCGRHDRREVDRSAAVRAAWRRLHAPAEPRQHPRHVPRRGPVRLAGNDRAEVGLGLDQGPLRGRERVSGIHRSPAALVARSEVSAVGNGAVFVAPTSSGPVIDLDVDNGDFIAEKGQPAIRVTRKARTDTDTVLQLQHLNRGSNYAQVITSEPDSVSIAKYGVRKKDPDNNEAVQDVAIARTILRIRVRRRNYVEPLSYGFTLNQRLSWLDSTDLVRITDRSQGIVKVPVRLTSWEENDKLEIACEAEPFAYGIHAPQALPVTTPQPYSGGGAVNQSAGNVNPPVIFEPVSRLYSGTQPQLWLVVSSPSTNYGGCQVYVSTDGGASYNPLGDPLMGSAITGNVEADWPAAADPGHHQRSPRRPDRVQRSARQLRADR